MRTADIFARPSAWLGFVGVALFLAAASWTVYDTLVPAPAVVCPDLPPGGPADRIRILDIGAAELQLRGSLCLIVDNVVNPGALAAKRVVVAAARLDVAQAEQALAAASAPVPATAVVTSRYGYRRIRTVAATPAAGQGRDAAKVRRDAAAAKLAAANADLAGFTTPRKLALFLNGERAPVPVRVVRGDATPQAVIFALRPEESAANERSAYWRTLLGARSEGGVVPVVIGIGDDTATEPAATLRTTPVRNGGVSAPLGLRVFRPAILWLAAFGLALMLIGLAATARATALLRDGGSRYSSYSLSRVQMAWWFGLTLAGFVYIWLVTGQYLDVMGSATFVLLGIAGATAGAARVVAGPTRVGESATMTHGFLADIAGGDRIELHRLQMIAWTIVLGAIYAYNIVANFTLTQFDANLLALAGVVNGVYVGLKTQEA